VSNPTSDSLSDPTSKPLFTVVSEFTPSGDQPTAIASLVGGLHDGLAFQTLLGATGTGKTYAIAKVIEETQRPALIFAPNKVLTAQLASEFKEFFPGAAVEFFVSYYDFYQPEAYVPGRDLFIDKDAAVNQELDRLRHSTTRSLLTRPDTIVVASVSAIYGLGSPEEYATMNLILKLGPSIGRDGIIDRMIELQYERNDVEIAAGRFRVKGDVIEIWPAYDERPMRLELWGDDLERIVVYDHVTGTAAVEMPSAVVYPAKHYVSTAESVERGIISIEAELEQRLEYFGSVGKLLEAQRLKERTLYDLEMMKVLGYCSGIENYSRHLDGRNTGDTPYTLLDFFPSNFITFIDESHVSVPQIGGMSSGDRSRKQTLVDYGFRLPSAMDNRPLNFQEFLGKVGQVVFVSATPGPYEREISANIAEQIIRPTGLVDPMVQVRPIQGQVEDLLGHIRERAAKQERVLVTTLTKKMSEDLTEYLLEKGVRARYLHSDIDTMERQVIIRDLRLGHYDVLVGINLLREGLDLPEVSLVAILDADKPGFLRSERSLIQTIGRAARNVNGEVILYGDTITPAMNYAITETNRRRELQLEYNRVHNITPTTIKKGVRGVIRGEEGVSDEPEAIAMADTKEGILEQISELELEMWVASEDLDFEKAAALRDQIRTLEAKMNGKEFKQATVPGQKARRRGRR
jgi:excinuclease ABC subunit B